MKFRLAFAVIATVTGLASCKSPENKYAFPVQDITVLNKTGKHVQIAGTRIFIVPPKGAKQDSGNQQLLIDRFTDIEFLEYTAKGFDLARKLLIGRLLLLKEKNPASKGLLFHKSFKLGKDSAIVAYGIDEKTQAAKITWIVGGATYSMLAEATFPDNQPAIRDEIIAALQTVYIDTTAMIDYAAISGYSIDTVNTTFRQHHREHDIVYFTRLNGGGIQHNFACVVAVPEGLTADKHFDVAVQTFLDNMRRVNKLEPRMVATRKMDVNGLRAVECTYQLHNPEASRQCLLFAVSNGRRSITFSGSVPLGDEKTFRELKQFARTIKMD